MKTKIKRTLGVLLLLVLFNGTAWIASDGDVVAILIGWILVLGLIGFVALAVWLFEL